MTNEWILLEKTKHKSVFLNTSSNIIKKRWCYSLKWLQKHVAMMEKILPNRILGYGGYDGDVFIDFDYISGITVKQYEQNNNLDEDYFMQVVDYWIQNAVSTFPYAHWDWHPGNTIITSMNPNCMKFEMIDWDRCRETTRNQLEKRMIECVEIAYKIRLSNIQKQNILAMFEKYFV